jgi:hypothetical protein
MEQVLILPIWMQLNFAAGKNVPLFQKACMFVTHARQHIGRKNIRKGLKMFQ